MAHFDHTWRTLHHQSRTINQATADVLLDDQHLHSLQFMVYFKGFCCCISYFWASVCRESVSHLLLGFSVQGISFIFTFGLQCAWNQFHIYFDAHLGGTFTEPYHNHICVHFRLNQKECRLSFQTDWSSNPGHLDELSGTFFSCQAQHFLFVCLFSPHPHLPFFLFVLKHLTL